MFVGLQCLALFLYLCLCVVGGLFIRSFVSVHVGMRVCLFAGSLCFVIVFV